MAISKIGSKALVDCSVAAVDIEDNSITSAKLAGSIANAKLANSSITVNGSSVSLGASGSIPAVSWQSVITADGSTGTTAVAGNGYFIDTTSAAHTLTLPSSPSAGDTVAIKDYAGTFGTNNLTIARNSSNIQGVANDSLISTNRASLTLVYVDATKGWLYAVESNVADFGHAYITATGGTVTESGDYKIHSFTGDGCFVVSCGGNPLGSDAIEYLVVAGGGGSGAGGGGAGGFRFASPSLAPLCYPAKPLAGSTITASVTTYPITVGGGGPGSTCGGPGPGDNGCRGSNSVFSTITSTGGGGAASWNFPGTTTCMPGGSGGGGGARVTCGTGGSGNTPPVSPPQGNNGGTTDGGGVEYGGSGGGGALAVGVSSPGTTTGANGGVGAGAPNAFGTSGESNGGFYYFSGGGGGSGRNPGTCAGAGGLGGGKAGTVPGTSPGPAGTANTGGGAGGGGYSSSGDSYSTGGNGGKGIVILRYKFQ